MSRGLAEAFLAADPAHAARRIEESDSETGAAVIGRCPVGVTAEVLAAMEPSSGAAVLGRLAEARAREVLERLPQRSAVPLLARMDGPRREQLLAIVNEPTARSLRTGLQHRKDTAGALMDSTLLAMPAQIRVEDARRRLGRRERPTGNYLYLLDDERKPIGVVSLRELMLAPPRATLASLSQGSVARIPARAPTATILAHSGWRELHALPVVDANGALVGVLRRETYERLRDEAAEAREGGGAPPLGLTLAELYWKLTSSVLDGLVAPAAERPGDGDEEDP